MFDLVIFYIGGWKGSCKRWFPDLLVAPLRLSPSLPDGDSQITILLYLFFLNELCCPSHFAVRMVYASFLIAKLLYEPVCPSLGPSVRHSGVHAS